MPRKTVYIWDIAQIAFVPPVAHITAFCGTYFLPKTEEKIENSIFDFGNEYFDNDCGQT